LLSEMMYPLEEDTSYLLLRGTSSHRERQSLHLLFEPKGVECLFPLSPVLLGSEGTGASPSSRLLWEQGAEARVAPAPADYPRQGGSQPLSELPFFAPYLASEGLLRRQGYSDSPPPLRGVSERKYGASPNSLSLALAPLLVSKRCQSLQFYGGAGGLGRGADADRRRGEGVFPSPKDTFPCF